ncbi:MAG: DUF503 domain-containing protein [Candidatus Eisenbacteria bacterium]
MIVGTALIELHIPGSTSLKAKRSVLNRIKERLKSRFNASVAEVDHHDLWQRASIGIALVGMERGVVENTLAKMVEVIESDDRAQIIALDKQFY